MSDDILFCEVPKEIITSEGVCRKWKLSKERAELLRKTGLPAKPGVYPVTEDGYFYFGPQAQYLPIAGIFGYNLSATAAQVNQRLKGGWAKGLKGNGGQPVEEPVGVFLKKSEIPPNGIERHTFEELEEGFEKTRRHSEALSCFFKDMEKIGA